MSAAKRKAALVTTPGGFKTNNIRNIMKAINSIAGYARITCTKAGFSVNAYASRSKLKSMALRCCDSIHSGASNTLESAGNPPDSGIFSRPEFDGMGFPISHGFGRDGLVREAGRMADSMFETSRPPATHSNAASGLQSQSGAKPMTKVNTPTTSSLDTIAQQAAIENALSMALFYIRQPRTQSSIHASTGKTARALAMLKTACTDSQIGGAA